MSTQTAGPMDSAADFSFRRNLKAVPVLFDSPTTFKFMHNNKHKHDREQNTYASPNVGQNDDESSASQTMSIAFREVFKSYADVKEDKHSLKQETQQERMLDSFSRGEKLLNSEDNVRPVSHSMSRSKTSANIKESKENITDIEERLKRSATKSTSSVHSHILESRVNESNANPKTPTSLEGQRNGSNNAEDLCLDKSMKSTKKGKKHRKRSNSVSVKIKKGKQGRMTVAATGTHYQLERGFHGSVSPTSHTSIKHNSSRVSSEPASKISLSSILSYTLSGNAQKRILATSAKHKSESSVPPLSLQSDISKTKRNSRAVSTVHSALLDNPFTAQGTTVTLFKSDILPRVKSGHSLKSELRDVCSIAKVDDERDGCEIAIQATELALTAKPCPQQALKPPTHSNTQHKGSNSKNSSIEMSAKEATLASIYGAVYQTANRLQAQVDDARKVRKVFLSEKQSGNIRESGVDYPCAPPATPNPDLLSRYEYVPSMGDIRSQQAVKKKLQVMERDAHMKKEKKKEEKVKQEKQQMKDREKALKAKQRREIYALNKIMTDLEYQRFLEFCKSKGLKL